MDQFLVQDDQSKFVGTIQLEVLKTIPSSQWSEHHVQDFVKPMAEGSQVQSDQPLLDVMGQLEKQGVQALAVIRSNGTLVGLLEKAQIIDLLRQETQSQPA